VYRQHGESRVLLGLLLMLGLAFIIEGLLVWRFPIESLSLPVAGDAVPLVAFFRLTTVGRAVRSVIQDEQGAQLCGVNPASVRGLIWAVAGMLAALVAVTRSMTSPIAVTAGVDFTILALIVAVVGGLGSVSGAFLAGVLLGIVNTVSSYYIGSYVTTIVLLLAAGLTIVLRPEGLLGRST
jgi:branched-chain amino acid transport system permease protein